MTDLEFESGAGSIMSRASAELVDDSDVPPAGTPCRGCRGLGHFCPAKCYRGESTALCRACANGVDCEVVAVKLRREEEILLGIADPQLARFDHPASAPRDVTPVDPAKLIAPPDREEVYRNSTGRAIAPFVASAKTPPVFPHARPSREVVRPAPSSVRSRVISHDDEEFDKSQIEEEPLKVQSPPFHFTAAHLDLIRNAPATQTDRELSELIGCKASAIWYQRSKIRKQPAAGVQSTAIAKKTPAKKVALCGENTGGVAIDMVDVSERIHELTTPLPATIDIEMTFPELGRLDAWWARQSPARKAQLILNAALGSGV